MRSLCTIQSHVINFQPFLPSFAIFHALLICFELNDPEIEKTTNELWKGWNFAWCHHFTRIACAKKLRVLRQKLDALRVQNGQSLSKYQGLGRKLICYKGISLFWTYLNSRLFVCSKCTIQSHISNFQPFLTSFVLFQAFAHIFELNDHENWQALQMIPEKVESWHGIIISPT